MKPIFIRGAVILASAVFLSTLWPAPVEAQRRAVARPGPRPGPRPAVVVGAYYRPVYYRGYYPYYYGAWYPYGGFGWGAPYGPWAPYGYGPYSYYQGGLIEGSVRVQVPQREAEVFVDGYYAGTVDEFDGTFQRLRLEPGEHEIGVYLAGHRPWTQKVYLQPGGTFNIRETLEPLGAGEADAPRPAPIQRPEQTQRPAARRDPRVPPGREPRTPAPSGSVEVRSEFAAVTFQVQPADAEILIDGERWQGPRADEALVVQLAPGRHQIEVRKDGYRTFTSEIDVAAGQSLPLNVSLPR